MEAKNVETGRVEILLKSVTEIKKFVSREQKIADLIVHMTLREKFGEKIEGVDDEGLGTLVFAILEQMSKSNLGELVDLAKKHLPKEDLDDVLKELIVAAKREGQYRVLLYDYAKQFGIEQKVEKFVDKFGLAVEDVMSDTDRN
ncbi:hypothetical protein KJ632_04240 [Patescibacteria group bacterium]|nr:hypothetical protein [Patescibacteria group bacterium]